MTSYSFIILLLNEPYGLNDINCLHTLNFNSLVQGGSISTINNIVDQYLKSYTPKKNDIFSAYMTYILIVYGYFIKLKTFLHILI